MSFAHPLSLWWLALAAPIVLLYILRLRLRRQPISTTMFWSQILEEKPPRSIWQKLRHLSSLLLQLALLLLLAVALSDPIFSWQEKNRQRVVLVVDNSASMNAIDQRPTRLEAARTLAHDRIDRLRMGDEMAIVTAGGRPKVTCGSNAHSPTLHRSLQGVPPTDAPTTVPEAVELAKRLIAGHAHGRIVVFTDGGFDKYDELTKESGIEIVPVGGQADNVALTQFQVRRSLIDPIGYQVRVEIRSFSREPKKFNLDLTLGDEIVDVVPIELDAGGTWSRTFEKSSAAGGVLKGSIDSRDDFSRDDVAWAVLPIRHRQKVTLVTPEKDLFLTKVFEAHPLVELTVAQELPESLPSDHVLVLHRKIPPTFPSVPTLLIDPVESSPLWDVKGVSHEVLVSDQQTDSPLMAHLALTNATIPETRVLQFKGPHDILASTVDKIAIYTRLPRPSGDVLVLAINLDRSDLPLRTSFPILVTNALSWFAKGRGELRESVKTGEFAPGIAESDSKKTWVLSSPSGKESNVLASSTLGIGPLDECGIWSLDRGETEEGDKTSGELIACNLANPRESDLRGSGTSIQANSVMPVASWLTRPAWYYLLFVGVCMVAGEWFLYQRRWIQ